MLKILIILFNDVVIIKVYNDIVDKTCYKNFVTTSLVLLSIWIVVQYIHIVELCFYCYSQQQHLTKRRVVRGVDTFLSQNVPFQIFSACLYCHVCNGPHIIHRPIASDTSHIKIITSFHLCLRSHLWLM